MVTDSEYEELKARADSDKVSIGEWVRRAIRRSSLESSVGRTDQKLAAIRRALDYQFPTGDIDTINRDIEEGRSAGLP
jgi:hypothetical protein